MTISLANPFVLWGHPLHSHTHSYIYHGFYRALNSMGARSSGCAKMMPFLPVADSVIFATDQSDHDIPLDPCFYYVLHHSTSPKYASLRAAHRVLDIEVYTHAVHSTSAKEIAPYTFWDGRVLTFPWATDLLPTEIPGHRPQELLHPSSNVINWVGTVGFNEFSNFHELESFRKACAENLILFLYTGLYTDARPVSPEQQMSLVKHSYMSPTIVGKWQSEHGYIPDRIFKNISYGQYGVTNSFAVRSMFGDNIIYNPDPYGLFYDARLKLRLTPVESQWKVMDYVAAHHTYVQRVESILRCLNEL